MMKDDEDQMKLCARNLKLEAGERGVEDESWPGLSTLNFSTEDFD